MPQLALAQYERDELIGQDSICLKLENYEDEMGRECLITKKSITEIHRKDRLSRDLDEHLALSEIKRNIQSMADAQIYNSIQVLAALGVEKEDLGLSRKKDELEVKGYHFPKFSRKKNAELQKRYFLSAIRYHEQKTLLANYPLTNDQKNNIKHKLRIMELRYPLVTNHNFKFFKDYVVSKFKITGGYKVETKEEEYVLDSYLLGEVPEKLDEVSQLGFKVKSNAGKVLEGLVSGKNEKQMDIIYKDLTSELQQSLAMQLSPLESINSFNSCQLYNVHSRITLDAINSSADPAKLVKSFCNCQKENSPIDEDIVMGLEMASLGGLGLCITPTGVGQIVGCPTAFVAGLGATGASTINFFSYMSNYSDISKARGVTTVLERDSFYQDEVNRLRDKELDSLSNIGVSRLIGLVGLKVGHIGMKGLLRVYEKSNISKTLAKKNPFQKERFNSQVDKLDPNMQTKMFVILDRLDEKTRNYFIESPEVLLRELKKSGGKCAL
ncbi:hypothetical protein M899_1939 [Bacteriovorax sp. BSW11_IV]|nr:hypothetical protein M899_1939 [Bacteriovorax sp. BSW11_IV]